MAQDVYKRQAYTHELLVWIAAIGKLGVDNSQRLGELLWWGVMISDNHINADAVGMSDLKAITNATIDRDEQAHTISIKLIDGFAIQTIALTHTMWNVRANIAAHGRNCLGQQSDCRNTIGIKIAIHCNGFLIIDGLHNPLCSLLHAMQKKGIMHASAVVILSLIHI